MNTLKNLVAKVQGYKTYFVAGTMVLYALIVVGIYQKNWSQALQVLLQAAAIAGLRNAI